MRLLLLQGRARHSVRAVLSLRQLIPGLRRAGDCAPYLIMLLLAWQAARAQSADDFFNGGAHFYISNSIPQALESVENGLKQYPDDVKLKKLYELLKQQQQSQNSQSQQNQNQQSQSQQQKSNNQQKQQQQNQQSAQQNSQPQKQNEQKQSGQKEDEQQKQQQQKSGEQQEKQNEQGQPVAAGQMTPEEAKRLLDAQKGNEQVLQLKPQGKPENPNQAIKDW
jgi:site-specific DNA-cytosine methylase